MSARMTAVDAQFYWMSAKVPNDEFLLYAFDGEPTDFERAVDDVRSRAQACRALTVRVEDGSPLTYPSWVPTAVEPERVIRHQLDDDSWRGCLDAVVRLADDQLDIRRAPWRLHLFAPVHDLPGGTGPGTVAVMQVAHALADGASRLGAGRLAVRPGDSGARRGDVVAGFPALARRRCRSRPSQARCAIPAPGCSRRRSERGRRCPPMPGPTGARSVRTLVRHRAQLGGPTVTVAVLAAVSGALSGHLGDAARVAGGRGSDG